MSREQVAALKAWLEGLTFTDVGLVGGSVSLSGKVAVLGPRGRSFADAKAPLAFLAHSRTSLGAAGMQPEIRSTYEVAILLPIDAHDEATATGAEVQAELAASLYLQLLGGYSYQSTIDSSSATYDHARRTLTVYAVLTLTLIL
jgi:hypothetical protein